MQNTTTQWRRATQFLEKYTSYFIWKVCMWEGVGDWTELHILTLTLLAITVFLSCSLGLLNREPEGPLCWVLAFSTASCHQWIFLSSPRYIIVQRSLLLVGVTIALIQPIHSQGYNSDIPWPDAPVIYIGAFPILPARPGRRSIYNNLKHL